MRLTGKYRYLTFEDRKKIEAWHLLGDRPVDIAARLSVHHTTIYKELQRGATGTLDANQREGYSAELAERRLRESFKRRGKRAPAAQLLKIAGKEEREMLVRLYAGEIIMGRITEDDVPAKLKARVHKYLVDMGYFDDVEE